MYDDLLMSEAIVLFSHAVRAMRVFFCYEIRFVTLERVGVKHVMLGEFGYA